MDRRTSTRKKSQTNKDEKRVDIQGRSGRARDIIVSHEGCAKRDPPLLQTPFPLSFFLLSSSFFFRFARKVLTTKGPPLLKSLPSCSQLSSVSSRSRPILNYVAVILRKLPNYRSTLQFFCASSKITWR